MRGIATIALCLAAAARAEKIKIGDLSTLHHAVSGEVFALDEKTIMIKDFNYDGAGPDAFFWVGQDGTPSSTNEDNTYILAYPYAGVGYYQYRDSSAPVLKGASNEKVTLRLPEGVKVTLKIFYKH